MHSTRYVPVHHPDFGAGVGRSGRRGRDSPRRACGCPAGLLTLPHTHCHAPLAAFMPLATGLRCQGQPRGLRIEPPATLRGRSNSTLKWQGSWVAAAALPHTLLLYGQASCPLLPAPVAACGGQRDGAAGAQRRRAPSAAAPTGMYGAAAVGCCRWGNALQQFVFCGKVSTTAACRLCLDACTDSRTCERCRPTSRRFQAVALRPVVCGLQPTQA